MITINGVTIAGGAKFNQPPPPEPGSVIFDRTVPQYLSTTVTAPSTDAVTYEWWAYPTASGSGNYAMLNTRSGGSSTGGIVVYIANTTLNVSQFGSVIFNGPTLNLNVWHHIALTRPSGSNTWTVYLNGSSEGTFTGPTTSSTTLWLGRLASNEGYTGYISNFRYVKGSQVYTGNFTPPISQLTAISGTDLLLNTVFNSDDFLLDSSGNNRTIINNGGAVSAALDPF